MHQHLAEVVAEARLCKGAGGRVNTHHLFRHPVCFMLVPIVWLADG